MDLSSFISSVIGGLIAAASVFIAHYFTKERDYLNARREIRIQFLLQAYRKMVDYGNRENASAEQKQAFEEAFADIMLLGESEELEKLREFVTPLRSNGNLREHPQGADQILNALRHALRSELDVSRDNGKVSYFRFTD